MAVFAAFRTLLFEKVLCRRFAVHEAPVGSVHCPLLLIVRTEDLGTWIYIYLSWMRKSKFFPALTVVGGPGFYRSVPSKVTKQPARVQFQPSVYLKEYSAMQ